MDNKVSLYNALKRMHELSDAGVPFSIEFITTKGERKVIKKALLRSGYRSDQSKRSRFLVAYTDVESNQHRQFNRSLLVKFNEKEIQR